MQYNTQLPPILLKIYGRGVQVMVQQAITIADREERNAFAQRIFEVMKKVSNQPQSTTEVVTKIWNHLAQISDYRLDVDYPCAIEQHTYHKPSRQLPYPLRCIRFRHYGALLERSLQLLLQTTDVEERDNMIRQIALRMRRNLAETRGTMADRVRVGKDIETYTNGQITAQEIVDSLTRTAKK